MVLLVVVAAPMSSVWRRNAILTLRRTYNESDGDQDVKDNIWTQKGRSNRRLQ
jgi:hypothetical protein